MIEPGDPERCSRKRTRSLTVPDDRNVIDHTKGTDRESEGAFTPTKSPCNQTSKNRQKAGDVGVAGHKEQIPYNRERFERRGCWSERTLPAFVSVRSDRTACSRTFLPQKKHGVGCDRRPGCVRSFEGIGWENEDAKGSVKEFCRFYTGRYCPSLLRDDATFCGILHHSGLRPFAALRLLSIGHVERRRGAANVSERIPAF